MIHKQILIQMAHIFSKTFNTSIRTWITHTKKRQIGTEAIWQLLIKHRLKHTSSSAYKKQDK